jgi:alanine racemase
VTRFDSIAQIFWDEGIRPTWIHSENSSALFSPEKLKTRFLKEHANLARPGIAMYGYLPKPYDPWAKSLKPILSLVAEVGCVKKIQKGEGVSYEALYRAKKSEEIYVLPLGYADGLSKSYAKQLRPKIFSAKGKVLVDFAVCGAICMDMVMLRSTSKKPVIKPGDLVTFWGPKLQDLILKNEANAYELNLRMAPRIPRLWVD